MIETSAKKAAVVNAKPVRASSMRPGLHASLSRSGKSFLQILTHQKTVLPGGSAGVDSPHGGKVGDFVVKELAKVVERWTSVEKSATRGLAGVSGETKSLIELQLAVYKLGMESQIISKVSESASGTLRRLQNLGAG